MGHSRRDARDCRATTCTAVACPAVSPPCRMWAALQMAANGFRSSWPTMATNSSLRRFASSAASRAFQSCQPAAANWASLRTTRSSSRSNFRSSVWLTIHTVPTGRPRTWNGMSKASTKRGSARSAGKRRSGRCMSWVTFSSMHTPHGLAARGIVPSRYEANTPATASHRNTSPSSRLRPAVSALHRSTAVSTRRWSMLRGFSVISGRAPPAPGPALRSRAAAAAGSRAQSERHFREGSRGLSRLIRMSYRAGAHPRPTRAAGH